jgi:protease-4
MEENLNSYSSENKPKKKKLALIIGISFIALLFILFFYLLAITFAPEDSNILTRANIGVVEINGIITNSKKYVKQLDKYKKNKEIKAIVVRINSPGGTVAASQEIHDEIVSATNQKPTVASFGDIAASGGYYSACGATKIVANPGTLTGSIGVILDLINIEDLLNWAKIKTYTIKSGKYKDTGSSLRSMTEEEKTMLANLSKNIHAQFKKAIKEGRGLAEKDVEKIADGRIMSGEEAKKVGLVDELGSFSYAINLAANLANIKGEPKILYPKKRENILDLLFGNDEDELSEKALIKFLKETVEAKLIDSKYIIAH